MTGQSQPRVAVVGMSESGRGWASLVAGAGWPLTIYDPDAALLHDAEDAVATRKRHSQGVGLPAMREPRDDSAPGQLRLGRSLLDAVSNADWIIDTTRSDLLHRQRLLEQVERAARMAAIVTCGAPGLSPTDLCARLRRPTRLLVAHALDPVEHVLAVEVVPGTLTDPAVLEELRNWLRQLGRVPIVLRKEVPGNATGRIAVAVWRECIRLVLDGVLEVRDVDVLVSSGLGGPLGRGRTVSNGLSGGRRTANGAAQRLVAGSGNPLGRRYQLLFAAGRAPAPDAVIERAYDGEGDVLKGARDERLAELRRIVGY